MPFAVKYNGLTYQYVTNLQGDVIALLNSSGVAVVEYTYDAWGNILSIDGDLASTLGEYNPLRYRSYVYDTETGLYYLQSRYYNPELGRFINADAFASTGQGILGNNMFAYCCNSPVVYSDPSGSLRATAFGDNHLFSDNILLDHGGGGPYPAIPSSKGKSEDVIQREIELFKSGEYDMYIDTIQDTYAIYQFSKGMWKIGKGFVTLLLPEPTLAAEFAGMKEIGNGVYLLIMAAEKWSK